MIRDSQASGTVPPSTSPGAQPHRSQLPQPRAASRQVTVIVDGSADSISALRRAASQARQRHAALDVICLLPDGADTREVTLARVWLGEFTRRACPYGVGAQVRLRVECGDPAVLLPVFQAEAELLITVATPDAEPDAAGPPEPPQAGAPPAGARRARLWRRRS